MYAASRITCTASTAPGAVDLHPERLWRRRREVVAHEVVAQPELEDDVVGRPIGVPLADGVEDRLRGSSAGVYTIA